MFPFNKEISSYAQCKKEDAKEVQMDAAVQLAKLAVSTWLPAAESVLVLKCILDLHVHANCLGEKQGATLLA